MASARPRPTAAAGAFNQARNVDCLTRKSSRYWLRPAVTIAIETCVRQSGIAGLDWERVNLAGSHAYADLPKTKNERPRRVPLSRRAVAAVRILKKL